MFNGVHFSLNAYNMQGVLKSRAQCVWLKLTVRLWYNKQCQYGMHGSINVPCREPIRWKPWECSEPYVGLPACNRPNLGGGAFTFNTHTQEHTQSQCTNTWRENAMYAMHTQIYIKIIICIHKLPFLIQLLSNSNLKWITSARCSSHLFIFDVWKVLLRSRALKKQSIQSTVVLEAGI